MTGPEVTPSGNKYFDYDGDGKADLAVFRTDSAVWYLQRSTAGFVAQGFGLPGDKPTPVVFVR